MTREIQPRGGVHCYACGAENERGLHMSFRIEDGRAISDYTPCAYQQGYPGRMHGGVVATLLDEAMGWAVYGASRWGATARLNVRFRRPVGLDQPLRVESWVTRDRGKLIELRAELRDARGALLAESDGTFMRLDDRTGAELSGIARSVGFDDTPPPPGEAT